jgi:hypothetical protein
VKIVKPPVTTSSLVTPAPIETTQSIDRAPLQALHRDVHADGHDAPGPTMVTTTTPKLTHAAGATASDVAAAQQTVHELGDADAQRALQNVQRSVGVEVPIRAKLATAQSRVPGEVPGIVRDRDGRTTFYPADESLVPFDLDKNLAKDLPRDVLLIARATKKKIEVVGADGADVVAQVYRLQHERESKLEGHFTGIVDLVDGTPFVRDITSGKLHPLEGTHEQGAVVGGHVANGVVVIDELVAKAGTAEARSWSVAATQHLEPVFPKQAVEEAKAIVASPGLDDTSLIDRRGEPFFAIDNHGSKDIDQAMRLTKRADGGFVLQYALADMAHAVKPGMALWDEAMHRGASFYLPGINVPMQPRDVCERGVSLNAHEDHRAVIVTIELDAKGNVEKQSSERALIHSRAQLTYPGVSAHLEGKPPVLEKDDQGHVVPPEVKAQLDIFRDLGTVLQAQAKQRGVVDPDRREMRIGLDGDKFFLHEVESDLASGLNAQLSILANCGAAGMLANTGIPGIEAPGIFRVHPPPGKEKLEALRRQLGAIIDANGAPASWKWQPNEALNDWVERMQTVATNDRERGLSNALQGQVLGIQVASEYSREPELHSGLMVSGYGRFTAPMREVVGLLSHATLVQLDSLKRVRALGVGDAELKPLWDHMMLGAIVNPADMSPARAALAQRAAGLETLRGPALLDAAKALLRELTPVDAKDAKLVDQTFEKALAVGNGSRMKQKQCDNASLKLLFDDLFMSDLGGVATGANVNAPVREGTVTSVSPGKVTVLLREPDVEVKLTRDDLGDEMVLERDGAELCCKRHAAQGAQASEKRVLVGSSVQIKATHHDGDKLHFTLV